MARGIQDTPTAPDELTQHMNTSPDELTSASASAGVWSLPSDEGIEQGPPHVPIGFDYSQGIFIGGDDEATAQAIQAAQHMIRARTDAPQAFQLPHEATHRRYDTPAIVNISQAAAGYTLLAAPNRGLHFVKLIAIMITLDAAGTIQFVQGPGTGTGEAAMTGALALGGGSAPGFVLPPATLETPWLFTASELAFGIITVTGKAAGWAVVAYSPYDQ